MIEIEDAVPCAKCGAVPKFEVFCDNLLEDVIIETQMICECKYDRSIMEHSASMFVHNLINRHVRKWNREHRISEKEIIESHDRVLRNAVLLQ